MRSEKYLSSIAGLFGGLLAGLSLSNGGVIFMWLAIALLWAASRNIFAGFLWGLVALLISHSWLLALHPLSWIGIPDPLSLPIAITIWLFCGLLAGLLVGLWSWIGNSYIFQGFRDGDLSNKVLSAVVLSCLWGLAEVVLAHYPLFWIGIGGSVLPSDILLAGLARWFGAGGLATVQLLIGFCFWHTAFAFRRRIRWGKSLSFGILFVALAHIIGATLLPNSATSDPIPVALWQSDIRIRTKFSKDEQSRIPVAIKESLDISKDLSAAWLVAPEGTLNANQELLSPAPIPFLTGGFRWVKGSQRSSLLVFESGQSKASTAIDKHRLVPLGEKVPRFSWFSLKSLSAVGGIEPGNSSRLLSWSGPPAAIAICYELSDGHAIAQAVDDGAQWILALANLDPYPVSLQKQFVAIAQLRSIETARDLISVANTGPSALVMASGEVQEKIPPFIESTELVGLRLHSGINGYIRWQEAPLIGLFVIGLSGILCLRFWINE